MRLILACLLALAALAAADNYGYSSCITFANNKVNENNNNADNQNRIMDSQNNAGAGDKIGPKADISVGSIYPFIWVQQHACGTNPQMWCEIILQYMCTDDNAGLRSPDPTQGAAARATPNPANPDNQTEGQHEHVDNFNNCNDRERNKGLFIADQNLNDNVGTRATRQNAGGTQHGFECPEERDYYPYWHPSPWHDIAILTSNTSRCEEYQTESQNVKAVNYCSDQQYNNEAACTGGGGTWQTQAPKVDEAPDCDEAPWNRGNTNSPARSNKFSGFVTERAHYNWTVPERLAGLDCVVRMRYNMSSSDYDIFTADASNNGEQIIENNPQVSVGMAINDLQLQLNTAQVARTFQDRSYVFHVTDKPATVADGEDLVNLCNCGGSGNIVQKYPAQEYCFGPRYTVIPPGSHVHIQMVGSEYEDENNNNEGAQNENRSNICPAQNNHAGGHLLASLDDQIMFENTEDAEDACHVGSNGGTLDGSPTLYDVGTIQFEEEKDVTFISSRNNQYTNRSQKGKLKTDSQVLSLGALIAIILGSVLVLAGAVGVGTVMYARANPHSKIGTMMARRSLLGSKGSKGHSSYQSGGSYGSYQRRSYQSKGSKGTRR